MRKIAAILVLLGVLGFAVSTWFCWNFVDLKVIPGSQQRYATVGDWWFDENAWHFRISEQPDRRYVWLLFVHEFTEAALCRLMKVDQREVDAFDTAYEERRKGSAVAIPGKTNPVLFDEPGDDPASPYHYEHVVATWAEHLAAIVLFVRWKTYNETIEQESSLRPFLHERAMRPQSSSVVVTRVKAQMCYVRGAELCPI